MNFLKQVIDVINKYEQKVELFDETDLENTTFHKLYQGVKSGHYSTDEDAYSDIYQIDQPDARYRNLKSRLKKKLIGNLFFLKLEQPEYSEYLSSVQEIFQLTFVMKTLGGLGAVVAACEVAEQVLIKAQKYHQTSAAIDSLILLQNHAAYQGIAKEYTRYTDLLGKYIELQRAEIEASNYFQEFKFVFTNAKSPNAEVIEKLERALMEATTLSNRYPSYTLFLIHFRLNVYDTQLKGDYALALEVCNRADDFYKQYPHFLTPVRLTEIASNKIQCYLYLRRYEEGAAYLESTVPLLREGGVLWFKIMEQYFLIVFHLGHYAEARKRYQQVTRHISFDSGVFQRKETWQILSLYLEFAEGTETPDMDRFMKDMEVYRADKSGVYVAVLALSILVLLRKGDYDAIITRDEYIKKYLTRYLRGDDHLRSAAFFKLLRLLAKNDFNLETVRKLGEKHIEVLNDMSLRLDDYEVMPYEQMWNYVVKTLSGDGKNSHKP